MTLQHLSPQRRRTPRKFRPGLKRPNSIHTVRRRIGKDCYAPVSDIVCAGDDDPTFYRGEYLPRTAWQALAAEGQLPDGVELVTGSGRRLTVRGGGLAEGERR